MTAMNAIVLGMGTTSEYCNKYTYDVTPKCSAWPATELRYITFN
jgi:hypothetical protein